MIFKWIYQIKSILAQTEDIFLAKSKGYDATKKRGLKEHRLGMSYVLRNKRISSKKAQVERVYAITKKISNAE